MTSATFHDAERPIVGRCPVCRRFWTVRHVRDAEIAGTLPAHDAWPDMPAVGIVWVDGVASPTEDVAEGYDGDGLVWPIGYARRLGPCAGGGRYPTETRRG